MAAGALTRQWASVRRTLPLAAQPLDLSKGHNPPLKIAACEVCVSLLQQQDSIGGVRVAKFGDGVAATKGVAYDLPTFCCLGE